MQSLMILGRQPALGLAELESIYGADKLQPVGEEAVIVDVDPCLLAFDRLGGSIKFCKLLSTLDTSDWRQVEKYLLKVSPDHSQSMPAGKMQLGISAYGFEISTKDILASGLRIKKAIQRTGRNVRLIPNKSNELNSAQVIHNKLTGQNGWELILIRNGQSTIIAQSVKVQDIESYTRRDRGRPKRDPKVGMLPPKLAQIIINLAAGEIPESKLESICDIPADQDVPPPELGQSVLDPFCGTGVIATEAMLMGYHAVATDLEPRMVEYTEANIDWLHSNFPIGDKEAEVGQADATNSTWPGNIDFVASETYLGQPFNSLPDNEVLAKAISNSNLIIRKFLQNIGGQLKSGTRLCLAVPAWQTRPGSFKFLPLIDQISDLGYNRLSFKHASDEDLIYRREDQVVARQLLIITRK